MQASARLISVEGAMLWVRGGRCTNEPGAELEAIRNTRDRGGTCCAGPQSDSSTLPLSKVCLAFAAAVVTQRLIGVPREDLWVGDVQAAP